MTAVKMILSQANRISRILPCGISKPVMVRYHHILKSSQDPVRSLLSQDAGLLVVPGFHESCLDELLWSCSTPTAILFIYMLMVIIYVISKTSIHTSNITIADITTVAMYAFVCLCVCVSSLSLSTLPVKAGGHFPVKATSFLCGNSRP